SQALSISKQINSDYEITVNLYAIGNNYVNLKNYNKALPFFKKSLQIATENNLRELMSDNYKALSIVYSFLGMYDNAYKNLYNYNLIKDSIFSRDIHRQITEIKTRYETEKKQKEIELLKRNILINQLKADKREQQWQLKLFILLALTIFIVLIVLSTLILLRLNHRRKLIIAEQKALRAQMNPHFIFNAMNSIQSLIVSRNNEAARKYLNRFSKLMRTILENSQKSTVKLNEELNSLMLYLEIEQLRFEHNFKYIINIDEKINCDDINLPPMLIQPLIENAIQHGLLPLDSKDGLLQLNFDLIGGDSLKITIKDNGIGRAKSAEINKKRFNHVSTGMKNIQERILLLKKIYKGKINFKVIDIIDENYNGAGTIVEIILPAITS
ncbi:MAG TPA: histidine kinase, partial [Bacteroidales bacterium]|nr:histidine kinase [Bacteroidales bacterium]